MAFGDRRLRSKMKETHEKLHFTLFEDIVSRAIHSSPKDWFKFLQNKTQLTISPYLTI